MVDHLIWGLRRFFEEILNRSRSLHVSVADIVSDVVIPLLDEIIIVHEVTKKTKNVDSHKSYGLDGLSSRIFEILPVSLLLLLVIIFNNVISTHFYPNSWCQAKCLLYRRPRPCFVRKDKF